MPALHPARLTFWCKPLAAAALAALADRLLYGHGFGTMLGVFALAWVVTVAATRPAVRHDRRALLAAAVAGLFALALIDRPGLVVQEQPGPPVPLPGAAGDDDHWRLLGERRGHRVDHIQGPGPIGDGRHPETGPHPGGGVGREPNPGFVTQCVEG